MIRVRMLLCETSMLLFVFRINYLRIKLEHYHDVAHAQEFDFRTGG